jgi:transposase InsO family protein
MRNYLTNQTLPPNIPKTTLWRWQKKWDSYHLMNNKIVSKDTGKVHAEDIQQTLKDEWPNVYGGRDKLYYYMKEKYDNVTQKDCAEFLYGNTTSQLYQQVKKQKVFRTIVSSKPNERWQCDWITLPKFDRWNYCFTLIDHNSKKAWVWPTYTRDQKKIVEEIKPTFLKYKPKILQCDNEFRSKVFEELCTASGTKMINSTSYKPNSNGLVERFNGTYKKILAKMMEEQNSNNWPIMVEKALEIYNNTWHRIIKATPLHNHENNISTFMENTSTEAPKFKINDTVRRVVGGEKPRFGKSFSKGWTEAKYKIIKAEKGDIAAYQLQNLDTQEVLKGKFYNHELLKV